MTAEEAELRVRTLMTELRPWDPIELKRLAWEAEQQRDDAVARAEQSFGDCEASFESALSHVPNYRPARGSVVGNVGEGGLEGGFAVPEALFGPGDRIVPLLLRLPCEALELDRVPGSELGHQSPHPQLGLFGRHGAP